MTATESFQNWKPDCLVVTTQEAYEAGWKACAAFYDDKRTIVPEVTHIPATTWTLGVQAYSNHIIGAEDIYNAYPRKVGKQAAIRAILNAAKELDKCDPEYGIPDARAYLMERVKAYAAAVSKWPIADKQFIPHPATWFNRGSYDDDPKEWSRGVPTATQIRSQN